MAVSASTTRRAALIGAAASCTALAVPAAQAAHIGEHPWEKARRLARELSAVLDEIAQSDKTTDRMVAIVEPASKGLAKLAELLNGGKQAA